jgi:hypothetical protein
MKLLCSLVLLALSAQASLAQDGSLVKNLLEGAGIIGEKPQIEHKERPPLVVPKNISALPQPVDSSQKRSAAWPKDSDEERAKRLKQEADRPQLSSNRPMTYDEMNKAWNKNAPQGKALPDINYKDAPQLTGGAAPSLLGKDEDKRIEFKGEGTRTSLTQPPTGYRTPSPNQPFGPVGKTDYSDPSEKKDKK